MNEFESGYQAMDRALVNMKAMTNKNNNLLEGRRSRTSLDSVLTQLNYLFSLSGCNAHHIPFGIIKCL
ncbi:MAG: hypothetical protein F4Z09_11190 [Rhodobacteraceae bacterium]|nr:hypothetical protein [Paracoccaceae bacterium]